MAENSTIEWTDHTFNPWEGCQKVGPGCDHCYAEARNIRFGGGAARNWGPGAPRRRTSPSNWKKPYKWNQQAAGADERPRVFCASLADVFDNAVPTEWRDDLWQMIRECTNLQWLLLTKRIGNVEKMLPPDWGDGWPHVTLMITVVNQEEADRDIPKLLETPAVSRGLSMEPLLEPVRLRRLRQYNPKSKPWIDALTGRVSRGGLPRSPAECGISISSSREFRPIDWVIAGGESGSGARYADPDWFRRLRDDCAKASTAFFMKQMTKKAPIPKDLMLRQVPEWPALSTVGRCRAGTLRRSMAIQSALADPIHG